ncbi:MAG: ribonuclease H-like domain-containing protein [Proteobacteria bacterium]|nr:ribonuclease H-like domain-containing protein [Pseudomonadota bacterium]
MGKNIVVFDIETKDAFGDVGGREWLQRLEISVLGAFDYSTGEYAVYEEGELAAFAERLSMRPLLVGFNSRRFDTPILQRYMPFDVSRLAQLDIMEEMAKALGHRVGLDSVARATLGAGKSGSGLEAIRLWREGMIEELKRYCLDDVRITREVFEYGAKNGELLYVPKFGNSPGRVKVAWELEHPEERSGRPEQQSLF